jgi:two-component system sensor histidine kinase/response regulator
MNTPAPEGNPTPLTEAELLRVLMDHLAEAVYFKDTQGRFLRINRTLASWYGLSDPEKAVGKTDFDFFEKELATLMHAAEQERMRTGTPQLEVEEKLVWPDGRVTRTSASKIPLRSQTGAIVGILGLYRDIGPHLEAQKEIRRFETLYRSLVDNLPQNVLQKDAEGRLVFANRQYCSTLGKPLKEILGKTDFDLYPSDLARKYREDDKRVMQTGMALDTVEAHIPPGMEPVYVRVVKTPVYDSDHRVVGVQGVFWEVPASN